MKVIVEVYNYTTKRSEVLLNILKYTIDGLNIVAVLYRDLVLEDKLNRL